MKCRVFACIGALLGTVACGSAATSSGRSTTTSDTTVTSKKQAPIQRPATQGVAASNGDASCTKPTGRPPLPSPQANADWFKQANTSPFRLHGIGVKVVASSQSMKLGTFVRASLVRDSTHTIIMTRKGVVTPDGLTIAFAPALPLPDDPNATTDTYSLYACVDTSDAGTCDGKTWLQPIGTDYQNTGGDGAVVFSFERNVKLQNGGAALINAFIATVSLDKAEPATFDSAALIPATHDTGLFGFNDQVMPNLEGNPGSGAQFIVVSIAKVTDAATGEIAYTSFGAPATATADAGGDPFAVTPRLLKAGHGYNFEMYTFRGHLDCDLGHSCVPDCINTVDHVSSDVQFVINVEGCTNPY